MIICSEVARSYWQKANLEEELNHSYYSESHIFNQIEIPLLHFFPNLLSSQRINVKSLLFSPSLLCCSFSKPAVQYVVCVLSHSSHVQLFATLWIVACQAPLSVEFSRQGYWSGQPFPSPGDLPDQGSNPSLLLYRWILTMLATRELLANFLYLWLVLEYASLPEKIYITCLKKGTTSVYFNQIESLQMGIVN